ncbi:helix-turn-helix protein [anaerobic digester metagenome]
MKIIERIFQLMEEKNIKYVELAEAVGVSKTVVSSWKSRNTNPPAESIVLIAELLNVSITYLLTGNLEQNDISEDDKKLIEKFNYLNQYNKDVVNKMIDERIEEQNKLNNIRDRKNLA